MFEKFDEYAHAWDTTHPREWSWHQWVFAAGLTVLLSLNFGLIALLVMSL